MIIVDVEKMRFIFDLCGRHILTQYFRKNIRPPVDNNLIAWLRRNGYRLKTPLIFTYDDDFKYQSFYTATTIPPDLVEYYNNCLRKAKEDNEHVFYKRNN